MFEALYARDRDHDQIDEMNRNTGFLFYLLQDGLQDDVMLRMSRLLDRANFGKRHSIAFELVHQGLPAGVDPAVRSALGDRITALRDLCDGVMLHRKRRIGHADAGAALKLNPLPPVAWADFRQALADAKRLVSDPNFALDETLIGFPDWGDERRQVDILMRVLKIGNDAIDAERAARRDRLGHLSGDAAAESPADLLNEPPHA